MTTTRARRLPVVLLVAAITLVGTPLSPPVAAAPPADAAEHEFLDLLNRERTGRGLPALAGDPALAAMAREWSAAMRAQGRLAHRSDLGRQIDGRVTTAWERIGENVGRGGSVGALHGAFMGSPDHRANALGDYNRVGVGVVVDGSTIWVTFEFLRGPPLAAALPFVPPAGDVWVATAAGDVHGFGAAPFLGSLAATPPNRPVVGMVTTPSRAGYWLVSADGGVFSFGDATFHGGAGALPLAQPVVGMAATPTGRGYWLASADGGVFSFGDARFAGSTGGRPLNQPIVGMAATRSGRGYWLVAADGGIFSFGDARFHGSTGGVPLTQPVVGMAATPSGRGYWLASRDGGIFTFGDAPFLGSAAAAAPTAVTGVVPTRSGHGYRLVEADGRVFAFGDAGAGASSPLGTAHPVVSLALPG